MGGSSQQQELADTFSTVPERGNIAEEQLPAWCCVCVKSWVHFFLGLARTLVEGAVQKQEVSRGKFSRRGRHVASECD